MNTTYIFLFSLDENEASVHYSLPNLTVTLVSCFLNHTLNDIIKT